MHQLLGITAFVVLVSPLCASDQDEKVKLLKKEIAVLEVKLAEKKAQLAKLLPPEKPDPEKVVPVVKYKTLRVGDFKVGDIGSLGVYEITRNGAGEFGLNLRVESVLDANRMIASGDGYRSMPFLVANFPTKDLADGKVIQDALVFKVTGTEKVGGKTLYVLEPYSPPKK
jgi:hypothetical protein